MIIHGMQYHRPYGQAGLVSGVIRDDLQSQWQRLTHVGLRLEMEILSDGGVSLSLTDPKRGDYATRIVRNVDDHPRTAVEEMVEAFDLTSLTAWRVERDQVETEVIEDPDAHDKPLATLEPETAETRNDDFMLSVDDYGPAETGDAPEAP